MNQHATPPDVADGGGQLDHSAHHLDMACLPESAKNGEQAVLLLRIEKLETALAKSAAENMRLRESLKEGE